MKNNEKDRLKEFVDQHKSTMDIHDAPEMDWKFVVKTSNKKEEKADGESGSSSGSFAFENVLAVSKSKKKSFDLPTNRYHHRLAKRPPHHWM